MVALCGTGWEEEWLRSDGTTREFVRLMCEIRHHSPTDEYEETCNAIVARFREIRDDEAAAEETEKVLPSPDLASFEGMFELAADTIPDLPPDRALTIAINAMRMARGRWGKEAHANANMNALLMAHAYTGLMLTGLGHPDFLTEAEKAEAAHG
ncbi:hypothetical protein TSO221_11430 [Azospirillum sp. TSO22-1]|nr:hypothetical protein TSO221_11430 [Azospirillum sp. TSO22-1]